MAKGSEACVIPTFGGILDFAIHPVPFVCDSEDRAISCMEKRSWFLEEQDSNATFVAFVSL